MDAYREIVPVDAGFASRKELWRLAAYLAVIAVDGHQPFGRQFIGRQFIGRLSAAIALYR